jgi:transcription elongation factor Elf1
MGKIKENPDDHTILKNRLMPNEWKCPHCGCEQRSSIQANDILIEYGQYIAHCENCGYLHSWTLQLTEKFKRKVIEHLLNGDF